jgi:hypothetical protein
VVTVLVVLLLPPCFLSHPFAVAQGPPAWLPRYDLDIHLDPDQHVVHVHETVTWVNRHRRPAHELVFNVFPRYKIPHGEVLLQAKLLEIYRLRPSEALDTVGKALDVERVALPGVTSADGADAPLDFSFPQDHPTALVVPLPWGVGQGQSVTVAVDFTLRLPQRQGRWGQWHGVTLLATWYPVLAYYNEDGWQPVPYVAWHPAPFNEAGVYTARLTLPQDQKVACTGPLPAVKLLGNGLKRLDYGPRVARDFALAASSRYQEFQAQRERVLVRCLAFPEHAYYAARMAQTAAEALAVYGQWFGPYPYDELTIVECCPATLEDACSGMLLMEERLFHLPEAAEGLVELMVCRQTCRQWWYNVIGVNSYAEAWLSEGLATYFSNRLLDEKRGKNNVLLCWPKGLHWLPQIERETYRHFNLCETIGRGECGPAVQELPKFNEPFTYSSLVCDRGGKVVGMIEDRLGPERFLHLLSNVYARYAFGVFRVADLHHELEACSGVSWADFFHNWLYSGGTTDWAIEHVTVEQLVEPEVQNAAHKVTVLLHQKAECTEPTCLGFCVDQGAAYPYRIPIRPGEDLSIHQDPPAHVEWLSGDRCRVTVWLPETPTQIAVDPDQVLVDRNPANNLWKPQVRWRLTPLYTSLDETDLTCAYDRWNIIAGPWVSDTAFNDPWFGFSEIAGFRLGAYRTQEFTGGVYAGYRTDFRDFAVGVDAMWDHWPFPKTQVGFQAERDLIALSDLDSGVNRAIVYGRYVFEESASFYQLPMHYLEVFGSHSYDLLPEARNTVPGGERIQTQTSTGLHYHLNMLAPYWDPEQGFQFDGTYAAGLAFLGERQGTQMVSGQLALVHSLPEGFGWLSTTRLAARLYGGAGLPSRGELFTLGGSQLFRGFDLAERQGNLVWIGSVEWRLPLCRDVNWDVCDHVIGLNNAYVATFYDVGDTYLRSHQVGPIAHAVGAGLRLDVAWISFFEHTVLRLDVAKTVNANTSLQFWFGIEHPF